jgi:hypothetical protein
VTTSALEQVRAIADAVLYEGYLLYPYRASAAKNKVRWQWGVLMPRAYADRGTGERAGSLTEILVEPRDGTMLHARLRFLHLVRRVVEVPGDDGFRAVPSLTVDGHEHTTWDEAVEVERDAVLPFAGLVGVDTVVPVRVDAREDVEDIGDGARLVRRRERLDGELQVRVDTLPGPFGGYLLTLRMTNASLWHRPGATRDDALGHALIAAHTLLSLSVGGFLSATDPPEWASVLSRECRYEGAWPVLVGADGSSDTVLCSPIILSDHPSVAPESAGNLFDGTEIDEILTLRTMTLTDEEKREARTTDPRAAELIDRVDTLPPELLDRLHGTIRYVRKVTAKEPPATPWWDPGTDSSVDPETDTVTVNGVAIGKGARVRLRPAKRADAHDMFLTNRTATVQAVLQDVDNHWHLAVTIEDDQGADLYATHGRYRYFAPEEVEPL